MDCRDKPGNDIKAQDPFSGVIPAKAGIQKRLPLGVKTANALRDPRRALGPPADMRCVASHIDPGLRQDDAACGGAAE